MFISEIAVFDIETNRIIFKVGKDYFGVVAEAKKGRDENQQLLQQQMGIAKQAQDRQTSAYNAIQPFTKGYLNQDPNNLSSTGNIAYQAALKNISDTYGGLRQVGNKMMAQRGFGGMPTGFNASIQNNLLRNQGEQETNAYQGVQEQDYQKRLAAANLEMGLQGIYNPTTATMAGSDIAMNQNRMGSTLGDVGAGLSQVGTMLNPWQKAMGLG